MAKKQKKKKMPVPLLIVLCVCVAALGLSIWQLSDIFLEYKAGTDEYDDLQQYVMAEVPEDAVVIGGESVYRQLLPRCSTVYLTRIFAAPQADAFFPDLSRDSAWTKAEQSETFTSGGVSFQYVTYRRK